MLLDAPSASSEVFEKIGTYEGWDRDYYHPVSARYYDRAVSEMLARLRPSGTVLDAGCGPGVHSIRTAQLGHDVRAVDISHTVLREAEARAQRAGVSNRIAFSQADLTELEFEDASFTAIFSWGVLTHIPRIDLALAELVRVLEPGGRLALQITNGGAIDYRLMNAARTVARKPLDMEQREFGRGCYYDSDGDRLWVWQPSIRAITEHLSKLGCRTLARLPAEFSELHRYAPSPLRPMLLRANNAWYRMKLPASVSRTNLLFFEKR